MDLDAFVCDRCMQQTAGRPVGYWTTLGFFEHSTGGGPRKISLEFCGPCVTEIQQAIGHTPRLPRPERWSLLRFLGFST